jgi:adrenodoxin-NADP+ reductase
MSIPSVDFKPIDESLIPKSLKSLPRPPRRIMEVLTKGSIAQNRSKTWSLDFCLSPKCFNASSLLPSHLGSMRFERTDLEPEPFDPNARAVATGEVVDIPSSLAFRSIGYKSEALPGFSNLKIPFNDKSGIIPNDHLGRVVNEDGLVTPLNGMYCAGWVKRGPTGVIASTMADAFQTAESIAEDWYSHASFLNPIDSKALGWDGVREEAELRGLRRVSWQDWKKIDAEEKRRGKTKGKKREKFTNVDDMLSVLD